MKLLSQAEPHIIYVFFRSRVMGLGFAGEEASLKSESHRDTFVLGRSVSRFRMEERTHHPQERS